jgi:hypothetical protein
MMGPFIKSWQGHPKPSRSHPEPFGSLAFLMGGLPIPHEGQPYPIRGSPIPYAGVTHILWESPYGLLQALKRLFFYHFLAVLGC